MNLSRIMYYSEVNPGVDLDLRQLLAICQKNNKRDRITGFLFFNKTYFLQVLEGSRDHVSARYHAIAADPRHKNLRLISCTDVQQRAFPTWLMGLHGGMDEEASEIFLQYFATDEVDPKTINADGLLDVMQLLALKVLEGMSATD